MKYRPVPTGNTPKGEDIEAAPQELQFKVEEADAEKRTLCGLPIQLVAGIAYCSASASMVLLNKHALSSFEFTATNSLLFFQCAMCVVLVRLSHMLGIIKLEPWNWQIVKVWAPVNVIFVGMIWTSFYALRMLGVPMVTVLKNLTNLFTIGGDYFMHGKRYGAGVWATLGLMALSAICGAATDIAFDFWGYSWQLVNCMFTAAYSLCLKGVMDKVAMLTVNKTKLDEFSMVFYNNLLSLPLILLLMAYYGELGSLWKQPALHNPEFVFAATCSGFLAFAISFASLWFLSSTTATTYSLVGSLNKIPIALLGLVAFDMSWTAENVLSVLVGLIAGVIFVKAKQGGPK